MFNVQKVTFRGNHDRNCVTVPQVLFDVLTVNEYLSVGFRTVNLVGVDEAKF
jgi:hypothetical protein